MSEERAADHPCPTLHPAPFTLHHPSGCPCNTPRPPPPRNTGPGLSTSEFFTRYANASPPVPVIITGLLGSPPPGKGERGERGERGEKGEGERGTALGPRFSLRHLTEHCGSHGQVQVPSLLFY